MIRHGDVLFAHSKEAADADNGMHNRAISANDQIVDVTDLLLLTVVHIQSDDFR